MVHKMKVNFGKDYIQILENKKEIVYWDREEWKEDPEVVFSIANAILLSQKDPQKLKRLLKK